VAASHADKMLAFCKYQRMGRPPIFDALTRTDRHPARHLDSTFKFYNRVAGPVWDRIRDNVESWFKDFPADGHADVRARLRSTSDEVFSGAFWELYLHQSLTRMGLEVVLHPEVPGTTKRPDFLVRRSGDPGFFLEATLASPSLEQRASQRRLSVIKDVVNDLATPNFFLGMNVQARGDADPGTTQLRHELLQWLDRLDPDALLADPDRYAMRHDMTLRWERAGWRIKFWPIPKSKACRGKPGRAIGVNTDVPVGRVDTSGPIRKAIKEKASRYGRLDRPYVIAVSILDSFNLPETVVDALYGSRSIQFDPRPDAEFEPKTIRLADGPWMSPNGPSNTRVSAAVTAFGVAPSSVGLVAPRLWQNPWAARPLTDRLAWTTSRVVEGVLVDEPATLSGEELLGLPPDWPGPEPAFPDL
jgi:hypothetical protein